MYRAVSEMVATGLSKCFKIGGKSRYTPRDVETSRSEGNYDLIHLQIFLLSARSITESARKDNPCTPNSSTDHAII
jgi:hypothetical protein